MNVAPDIQFVVRTAAVHDDNPEIVEARARGVPVFERAEAWGAIMCDYDNALCIAGTHGKTTTTSMCTHILMAAERDPTVMIGGTLPLLHAGHRVGGGDTIILESCEYHDSLPRLPPDHRRHPRHRGRPPGLLHRPGGREATPSASSPPRSRSTAASSPTSTTATPWTPSRPWAASSSPSASPTRRTSTRATSAASARTASSTSTATASSSPSVTLHIPGIHNVKNALAATAACICLGVRPNAVKYGLAGFNGAGRRFEFKGKYNGADVYDDYAHHPGELKALLDAVEPLGYKRTILVFQPHTYTRTAALFDDFIEQLCRPDVTYLAEIYAARETNTFGISSADLARQIPGSLFFDSFEEIENSLRATASPGDVILTVGAGNVYKIGEDIVE